MKKKLTYKAVKNFLVTKNLLSRKEKAFKPSKALRKHFLSGTV